MDGEKRVSSIFRTLEHCLKLKGFGCRLELVCLAHELSLECFVGLSIEQLGHLERSTKPLIQIVVGGKPVLENLDLLHRFPRGIRIGPKPGQSLLRFQRLQPLELARQVKESLEVR